MRSDMSKIIVERPRHKDYSVRKYSDTRHMKKNLFSKEGMKNRYRIRKNLNENLSPLKRFLNKQVGRPWNKVYSEISRELKCTSAVQQHVRDHIWDYVEKNVIMKDRVAYRVRYTTTRLSNGELYINPVTGILCKVRVSRFIIMRGIGTDILYYRKTSGHSLSVRSREGASVFSSKRNARIELAKLPKSFSWYIVEDLQV